MKMFDIKKKKKSTSCYKNQFYCDENNYLNYNFFVMKKFNFFMIFKILYIILELFKILPKKFY